MNIYPFKSQENNINKNVNPPYWISIQNQEGGSWELILNDQQRRNAYLLLRLSPNSLNLKQKYKQLLITCSVGKKS